jgi:hypothetical protein
MIGRLDDHLKKIMQMDRGYRSKLLAAAYRNLVQWSDLVGGDLILTLPYKWWKQLNASEIEVTSGIENPSGYYELLGLIRSGMLR